MSSLILAELVSGYQLRTDKMSVMEHDQESWISPEIREVNLISNTVMIIPFRHMLPTWCSTYNLANLFHSYWASIYIYMY